MDGGEWNQVTAVSGVCRSPLGEGDLDVRLILLTRALTASESSELSSEDADPERESSRPSL